jgi:ribonucleoside-diphosphate reductase beta chain
MQTQLFQHRRLSHAEALTAVSGQEAAIHGQPMHTPAPSELKPVNSDDKRVINGMTDINQLAPFKYPMGMGVLPERKP